MHLRQPQLKLFNPQDKNLYEKCISMKVHLYPQATVITSDFFL